MNPSSHCQLCDNQIVSLTSGTTCFLTKQKPLFSKRCPQISLNEKFEDKLINIAIEYEKIKKKRIQVYLHFVGMLLVALVFVTGGYFFGKYIWEIEGEFSPFTFVLFGIGILSLPIASKPLEKYRHSISIAKNKKDKLSKILKVYYNLCY